MSSGVELRNARNLVQNDETVVVLEREAASIHTVLEALFYRDVVGGERVVIASLHQWRGMQDRGIRGA